MKYFFYQHTVTATLLSIMFLFLAACGKVAAPSSPPNTTFPNTYEVKD